MEKKCRQLDAKQYISSFLKGHKELIMALIFVSFMLEEGKRRPGRLAVRDCLGRNEAKLK